MPHPNYFHYVTSALLIKTDFGPIANVTLEDNYFAGGAYTVYSVGDSTPYAAPTNVTIRHNPFEKDSCAFGVADVAESNPLWVDNYWAGTTQHIDQCGNPIGPPDPDPGGGPFSDVSASHTFANDVAWLADEGIMRSCNPPSNTKFCPDSNVARGQMAAFLVRVLGLNIGGGSDRFNHDDGTVFESNINRLAVAGITRGCSPPSNTRFCPSAMVTRAQMAAFLVRASNLPGANRDYFGDDGCSIYENDINRIAKANIT